MYLGKRKLLDRWGEKDRPDSIGRPMLVSLHHSRITLAVLCLLLCMFMTQAMAAKGFAVSLGGVNSERAYGVDIDSLGNIYTIGSFEGTADFDPGLGTLDLVSAGGADIFVSKLDADGSLVWAISIGGIGMDQALGLHVDGDGTVYATGSFSDTVDFDPGIGILDVTSAGATDIFVIKLDSSGNLIWARTAGATGSDASADIFADASGNVYTTGTFEGTVDFDPGVGATDLTSAGNSDAFIWNLDSTGSLTWARQLGGAGTEIATGIAVGLAGDVFTTGTFEGSADFDPGPNVFNMTDALGSIFVSKLDASGTFSWARAFGGAGADQSLGISLDSSDNVFTTGSFEGTADFDPDTDVLNLTSAGLTDIFISKIDTVGNLVWARSMGGTDADTAADVFVNVPGDVFATGQFAGTATFDAGAGTGELTSAGGTDVFVSKISGSGDLIWVQAMGGVGADESQSVVSDTTGKVYTTGSFEVTADFDPGGGLALLVSAGQTDAFVSRLNPGGFLTLLGDVNGDDVVNAEDAVWMIQFEFGLRSDLKHETADVNGDGTIDSTDALWAIQIENGLRVQP